MTFYFLFSYDDKTDIIESIRSISATATSSNTPYMLDFVRTRFFNPRRSEAYRQRSNSVSAVVVFSGGKLNKKLVYLLISINFVQYSMASK